MNKKSILAVVLALSLVAFAGCVGQPQEDQTEPSTEEETGELSSEDLNELEGQLDASTEDMEEYNDTNFTPKEF